MTNDTLHVRIVCTELPGTTFEDGKDPERPVKKPVHLGIQRGRAMIDAVPAEGREATFRAEFRVGERPDGLPNFLGPYAQGTPDDRFFYLWWGVKERDGTFTMFRRLKVRLGHLRWSMIRPHLASGKPITVKIRMTDARGGPLCATPPEGHVAWEVGGRSR